MVKPPQAPGGGLAHGNSSARATLMDLESGVRLGSLCPSPGAPRGGNPCPVAADVLAALDAAAAADEPPATSPLCLLTSLTDAYVEGHCQFIRSSVRHAPAYFGARGVPVYVLDQSLSAASRARVEAAYGPTLWMGRRTSSAKDVGSVTKFALNKEKVGLFGLRSACGAVLKIDTGDMLPLRGFADLFRHHAITNTTALAQRSPVWAAQALGQPVGKINGGLMLFGRYWLHAATHTAIEERANRESREQSLFDGFFSAHMAMLPKRYNVEMRFWDAAHEAWRQEQLDAGGAEAVPPDATEASAGGDDNAAAVLHYVGRDKPWMRYDRGRSPDTADDLCRRLREKDAPTCARYLATQAMWWRAFGVGRCLIVGVAATHRKQGFVIDSFETVLRMHPASLPAKDTGNTTRAGNLKCADVLSCLQHAKAAGCDPVDDSRQVLSLGREEGLPKSVRSLLDDVYRPKLGVFGGPPTTA